MPAQLAAYFRLCQISSAVVCFHYDAGQHQVAAWS
jgi:hypothetical protein